MTRSRTTLAAAAALAAALSVPALAQTTFRYAVTQNLDSNNVSILDTVTHTEVARVKTGQRPWDVAMSPDGRFAYVGEDGASIAINEINLQTRKRTRRVVLPTQDFITEEVSPDGRWLATADIYRPGENGFLAEGAEWPELVARLLASPPAGVGEAARRSVPTPEDERRGFLAVFDEVLARRTVSGG